MSCRVTLLTINARMLLEIQQDPCPTAHRTPFKVSKQIRFAAAVPWNQSGKPLEQSCAVNPTQYYGEPDHVPWGSSAPVFETTPWPPQCVG